MTPLRVIGWALATILVSGATICVIVAGAFLYGLAEMVFR